MINLKAYVTLILKDKHGNILEERKMEANSFVGNFLFSLFPYWANNQSIVAPAGMKSEDGVAIVWYNGGNINSWFNVANKTRGICLGTGNTPVAVNDYHLAAKIADGVGAGQLQIDANHTYNTNTMMNYNGTNTCKVTIGRNFTNNSGNTISVTESGIVSFMDLNPAQKNTLMERTVFNAFNILNTQAIQVIYEFSIVI